MFEPVLLKNCDKENSHSLEVYSASGGYEALRKALREYQPEQIIELVKESKLRGRGGAGFPTGLKWSFIPKDPSLTKYLCCNADEGEPGTFKDRIIMEKDPHLMIEGIAIACYAVGAEQSYIYIRGEYSLAYARLEQALAECYQKGLLGKNILGSTFNLDIGIHRGAGAYICGEESSLLESLEGYRGEPRLKPPFPAIKGLYACPTVINNPETLACVPHIVMRGAKWFNQIGSPKGPGPRLFSLSGKVKYPGVYEIPTGTSLRELIEKHGGGTPDGSKVKAVIPGGASSSLFPESQLDIALDFDEIAAAGSMAGSAGVIVMDENDCIVKVTKRILEFFHDESCGKCTPCREGLGWVVQLLRRIEAGEGHEGDVEELERLGGHITGNTFCALGDGAIMALRGAIKYFRNEFDEHIKEGRCRFA